MKIPNFLTPSLKKSMKSDLIMIRSITALLTTNILDKENVDSKLKILHGLYSKLELSVRKRDENIKKGVE